MRSLLIRIFLSFWLIIGVSTGVAAVAGYYYAERMREAAENFQIDDALLEASRALDLDGRNGLERWLRQRPRKDPISIYVLDAGEQDLLGRRVPRRVRHLLHKYLSPSGPAHRDGGTPGNLRPARPLTQLVAPDGSVFTLVAVPTHHPYRRWLDERLFPLFLLLALLVSGSVSYLLARTLSQPVRYLRDAAVAIAGGALDTRVSPHLKKRRDELGLLARDFDRMASELQKSYRQQTELSRNISHELRSPLARLRVALELARREAGELPELARIDVETERLDQLIGQILRYTRLDANAVETPQHVELRELLREVVENVNYECRDEGIDGISVTFEATVSPTLAVYPEALKSAVENVLRNAVQHSPADSTVDVSLQVHSSRVVVSVVDRGPGVDPEELGELFEPFFRTRSARHSNGRSGSGLGLAIAARAVRLHRGAIRAENRSGGGLGVVIELPLAEPSVRPRPSS